MKTQSTLILHRLIQAVQKEPLAAVAIFVAVLGHIPLYVDLLKNDGPEPLFSCDLKDPVSVYESSKTDNDFQHIGKFSNQVECIVTNAGKDPFSVNGYSYHVSPAAYKAKGSILILNEELQESRIINPSDQLRFDFQLEESFLIDVRRQANIGIIDSAKTFDPLIETKFRNPVRIIDCRRQYGFADYIFEHPIYEEIKLSQLTKVSEFKLRITLYLHDRNRSQYDIECSVFA